MKKTMIALTITGLTASMLFAGCGVSFKVNNKSIGEVLSMSKAAKATTKTFSFDNDITSMTIDGGIGNIYIQQGDALKVECNYPKEFMPEVNVYSDELVVDQTMDESLFYENCDNWYTTITLPAGCNLSDFQFDVNIGDLWISNVNCENLYGHDDMGDIEFENTQFENIDVDTDLGDIIGKSVIIDQGKCSSNLGDINLEGSIGDVRMDTELGDVIVNGKTMESYDYDEEQDKDSSDDKKDTKDDNDWDEDDNDYDLCDLLFA